MIVAPGRPLRVREARRRDWVQSNALARLPRSNAWPMERAAPSPLADTLQVRPCRLDGRIHAASGEDTAPGSWPAVCGRARKPPRAACCLLCLKPGAPTISTGPCRPTVAGAYAAWMPCRAYMDVLAACPALVGRQGPLQPNCRPAALPAIPLRSPAITADSSTPDPSRYGVSNNRLLR